MLNIAQDVGKKQAGVTYAIRTDVMYRRLPKEQEDGSGVLFTSNGLATELELGCKLIHK